MVWLVLTLMAMVTIVAVGWVRQEAAAPISPSEFTVEMSIKQIAPRINVTNKNLARELGLSLDVSKKKPVKTLGVTQEELDHAIEHLLGHR